MKISKVLGAAALAFVIVVSIAWNVKCTVHATRTFNAPLSQVWDLWKDPEAMKKWWSPKNYTAPVIENNFVPGGRFLFSMKSPKGEMYWNTGVYKEITERKRVVSTMSFSNEKGETVLGQDVKVPGRWPDEILVTVEFLEVDGKTSLSVREEGIPLIMKVLAKLGWEQQFDKFEALIQPTETPTPAADNLGTQ